MKSAIKPLGVSALLLTLAGCADFQLPQLPQLPTLPSAPAITDTVDTVCEAFKSNAVRAKSVYIGKRLSATATVTSVGELANVYSDYDDYQLLFEHKKVNDYEWMTLSARVPQLASNTRWVSNLSVGDKGTVSGVIESVENKLFGCDITLKRTPSASFTK